IEVGTTPEHEPIRVFCNLSQEKMLSLLEDARTQTFQLTIFTLTISILLAIIFSERVLTSRIRNIRDGAGRITQGDLSFRLLDKRPDELGDLSGSFNEMAATLEANRDRLLLQNEELQVYLESLENMKTYIQNILTSLPTCLMTWNNSGKCVTANSASEKIFKEHFKTLQGLSILRFLRSLNDKSRKTFLKALRALLSERSRSIPFELDFDRGTTKGVQIFQCGLSFLRNATNDPDGMILTLEDITERRIIEQQLYHSDKLSSIGTLAASVAHEIKNPLASIKTLGQLLQEDVPPQDSKREYIDVIVSEVNRLNNVVEQLLKFAKPEESCFKSVDLSDLIKPVISLIRHESDRHKVQILCDIPGRVEIHVDAEKIKQVFLNLFFNAIQAMPNGGTIRVNVLEDFESKQWVICNVEDEGSGMSKEVQEKVFEPFFTTKQRGTGLGLAIVKKIIDLHGGKIEVKSLLSMGTTFTLYLPRQRKG
ncbi:HAMP domain-containing protein, partial [bacterium]|nr:HAMP domain-containing protein [bacterium]